MAKIRVQNTSDRAMPLPKGSLRPGQIVEVERNADVDALVESGAIVAVPGRVQSAGVTRSRVTDPEPPADPEPGNQSKGDDK